MNLTPQHAVAAVIKFNDGRYLLQLRDNKPDIWFPNHWGLFGGAIDDGETPKETLMRELNEELGIEVETDSLKYFTRFDFDFSYAGHKTVFREYYSILMSPDQMSEMTLGEGQAMQAFTPSEITNGLKIAPYDSLALWMHINHHDIENEQGNKSLSG